MSSGRTLRDRRLGGAGHRRQASEVVANRRLPAELGQRAGMREPALVHEDEPPAQLLEDLDMVGLVRVEADEHHLALVAQAAEEIEHEADVAVLHAELRL